MVLTAVLMTTVAVFVCLASLRAALRLFDLDLIQALVWLGVAEVPAPAAPRRERIVATLKMAP